METNKEKSLALKTLLEIAQNNGWEKISYEIQSIRIEDHFVQLGTWSGEYHWFSLNDLVTNFEEGKVSFIDALCKTDINEYIDTFNLYFFNSETPLAEAIRLGWNIEPTSKRLEWLLKTFNHLLTSKQ